MASGGRGGSGDGRRASVESRAAALFQKGEYADAAALYTECLQNPTTSTKKDVHISLLFNRAATYSKLKQYDNALQDCQTVLSLDPGNTKALSREIKALCSLGRFLEAHKAAQLWLTQDPTNVQAKKEEERLGLIVSALEDQDLEDDGLLEEPLVTDEERIPPEGREDEAATQSPSIRIMATSSASTSPPQSPAATSSSAEEESGRTSPQLHPCTYCNITFQSQSELHTHCQSDLHKKKVSYDDGRDWKHRPPPRGLTSEEYTKCPRYFGEGTCRFNDRCSQAHSEAELAEWKERFEYRRQRLQQAKDSDLNSNTYAEQLLEKWMNAENPGSIMTDNLEGINVHVNAEGTVTMATKRSSYAWMFTVTSKVYLRRVVLLDDASRCHFYVASVTVGPKRAQKSQKVDDMCQEWTNPAYSPTRSTNEKVYRIKIVFKTDIFGTFRQSVVLDFGTEPVYCRQLCVDSTPVAEVDKLTQDLTLSQLGRWDLTAKNIVEFQPKLFNTLDEDEVDLLAKYPPPMASQFSVSDALQQPELTRENYKERMHDLLSIEEMAQFSNIAKFNVKASLNLVDRFLLMPSNGSTAKFAQGGELFARLKLNSELSEDTAHGRLILQNVNTVYVAPHISDDQEPETVYEAMVEDKCKTFIFLRLSKQCVMDLNLKGDSDFKAQVQFQLNRLPLCDMHRAVDRLSDTSIVFPDLSNLPVPWNPKRHWAVSLEGLNARQKEAVMALTTDLQVTLPPVLIVGPYGTGKTYTLAQTALHILTEPDTRVLICTHSNSAADLYVKDYLHPQVEAGKAEAKPLRVLYRHRWIQTVHPNVLQYCLKDGMVFRKPTREEVLDHRVIVTTLGTSRYLYDLELEGSFTHILLDEAAQAQECETIMPLTLAGKNTRIVLAGDHMQLSPEVHSTFARERGLHISFLERMFDLYSSNNPCKIMLCENYRSHKAIIDYTSELFYNNSLIASGNQPRHDNFYPLSFFTARGEDVQHANSTGFYNNSEVYEVVERVSELQKQWPKAWGDFDETSIGVVSPYSDQVVRIRSEMRKRKMFNISVERVLNVQGKQFRVMFLSTVRTRTTCSGDSSMEEFMDYGFLSNVKLLNTAITRAQSLVAVVGDPVSLCSIGKCRKLWERFIELTQENGSLNGITWHHLRAQLDGVELKKTYILNPLAPEFIPNRLRHAAYTPPEPVGKGKFGYTFGPVPNWMPRQKMIVPNTMPPPVYCGPMMPMPFGSMRAYPPMAASMWSPRGTVPFTSAASKLAGTPIKLPPSSKSKGGKSKDVSGEDGSGEELAGSPVLSLPNAQAATGMPLHKPGMPHPHQQHPPMYAHNGFPSQPFFRPPFMMSPGRGPLVHPPMPLGPRPPHMIGHPMSQRPMPPFMGASGQFMGPPILGPVPHSQQITVQTSPPHMHLPHPRMHSPQQLPPSEPPKALITSPTGSGRSTPQIQFLPNVCNVKASSSPSASAGPVPAVSENQRVLQNIFLQREVYSYILQSEGPAAASNFMQMIQDHSQRPARTTASQVSPPTRAGDPPSPPLDTGSSVETHEPSRMYPGQPASGVELRAYGEQNLYTHAMEPRNFSGHFMQQSNSYSESHHYSQESHHYAETSEYSHEQQGYADPLSYNMESRSYSPSKLLKVKRETVSVQLEDPPSSRHTHHTYNAVNGFSEHGGSREFHQPRGWPGEAASRQPPDPSKLTYSKALAAHTYKYPERRSDRSMYAGRSQFNGLLESTQMNGVQSSNGFSSVGDTVHTQDDLMSDLERPPTVDDMVRFIEESLDDRAPPEPNNAERHNHPPPPPPPPTDRQGPLYMRRAGQLSQSPTTLSYASALRSQPLHADATEMPQTTVTLTASQLFSSVRQHQQAEAQQQQQQLQDDPLDLLKNLNIKASPGTQALYQYFS